jgi:Calcineurin-like phosphoesterase
MQIIALAGGTVIAQPPQRGPAYSFVYLGDIHFDRKSDHDFEWVRANKPNDVRQIEEYTRYTAEHTPGLMKRIQTAIEGSDGRIQMVVQGGDLIEGLCGSQELQETQFKEVQAFVREYIPATPFIAVKGNHDITGPGAKAAYDRVMLPWLSNECSKPIDSASFFIMQGPDLFVFFDAYHNNNLDWLEKTLSQNRHRYAFVVMHPPAVPYNARSNWHLFWRPKDKAARARFLNILGANKVVLLTGHLHKYSVVGRRTPKGDFVQLSISSVISSAHVSVRDHLEGVENYGSRLVELEPEFQPDTKQERQKLLEDEKPYITRFEYADFPGYAIISVSDAGVSADVYTGDSGQVWKSISLLPAIRN